MTRKQLFNIIEKDTQHSVWSMIYDYFMFLMIIISIIPLTFSMNTPLFVWFDRVSVTVFIFDYIFRWITADFRSPEKKPPKAFVLYPITFLAIID